MSSRFERSFEDTSMSLLLSSFSSSSSEIDGKVITGAAVEDSS